MNKILKIFNIALLIVVLAAGSVAGYKKVTDNKETKNEYKIESIIESISEDVEVERKSAPLSANEVISQCSRAMVFRMQNDVDTFPEYVHPAKIIVDAYDNIILIYHMDSEFEEDFEKLTQDAHTLFVEEINPDDIVMDENAYDEVVMEDLKHNSYAAGLMNTDLKVKEIVDNGIKRKITIGFLDTGLYSENSIPAGYVNLRNSYDYVNDDNDVLDETDTHVTMVISTYLDIVGKDIAADTNILVGKCLENGKGSFYDLATAIMDMSSRCDIINMSLGAGISSDVVEYAVNYAKEQECILICASGNESSDVSYPAAYEYSIAVSAIDANKNIAYFSNTGSKIEFTAPGVKIIVDDIEYTQSMVSGTSFSTPIITAVTELAMLDDSKIKTRDEVIEYLKNISDDIGNDGKDAKYGYGLPVFRESDLPVPPEETATIPETTREETTTAEPETTRREEPTTQPETTRKKEPTTEPETTRKEEPTTQPETTRKKEPATEPETTIKEPGKSNKVGKVTSAAHSGTSYWDGERRDYYARYSFNSVENAVKYEVCKCDYHGEELSETDGLNWKVIGETYSIEYKDYDISADRAFLIRIRAIDIDGNAGEWSDVFQMSDYSFNPTINVTNITGNTATVSWTPYQYNAFELTGYEIYLYEGDARWPEETISNLPKNQLSYQLSGLELGKTYRVLVLAEYKNISYGKIENRHGTSAYSVSFTMK